MKIFKETTGHGKDIVILHGWGGCNHRHMQPVVDQLANRYRVTNFDLPGMGQSDWHSGIDHIHDIADQLLAYLPERAIYIGWSFGGLVATSIAARYPEKVSHFIGLCTSPKFIASDNWSGVPQPGFKASFSSGIRQQGLQNFMQVWYDGEFAAFDPKPKLYHELIGMLRQGYFNVDLDILSAGVDICDATDLREELKSLRCPIDLIMSGQDDAVPLDALEKIKALNSNINIHLIPTAHHLPFWTHPDEFNKILNNVL